MLWKSIIVFASLLNILNLPITSARFGTVENIENDEPGDDSGGDLKGGDGRPGGGNSTMTGLSVLVDAETGVTFALNVPNNSSNELFFTLKGPCDLSWIAVGMGSPYMKNSLFFIAYQSSNGKNVTVSPRTVDRHVEPSYTKDVSIEMLPGSGVSKGVMVANVHCTNCRTWMGGSIDVTSFQPMIYATGPKGTFKSNSREASIKRHDMYGTFMMDLVQATGDPGVDTSLNLTSSSGAKSRDDGVKLDHNTPSEVHAIFMVATYFGVMPAGIFILRVINSVKWHAWNQAAAVILAIIGAFAGIYAGTFFNRSKNINSGHQVFGLFISAAVLVQVTLGFLHHRIYKKTGASSKLAPVHVWLGRIIIPCGMANASLGFPFALNGNYNWILLAIAIGVVVLIFLGLWWRRKRNNRVTAQRPISLDNPRVRYEGSREFGESGPRGLKWPGYTSSHHEYA